MIYSTGYSTAASRWITRRSTDDGLSWSDVDNKLCSGICMAAQVRERNGTVYVAGTWDNGYAVRKSTDGGTTWTFSDQFSLDGVTNGEAYDLTSTANKMWSVGAAYDGTIDHWITRWTQP